MQRYKKTIILIALLLVVASSANSLSAQNEDSAISLSVSTQGNLVQIDVEDHKGDLEHVEYFKNGDVFYRAYSNKSKEYLPTAVFIFDDGWLDVWSEAYPVFDKHNVPASVAVISTYVDQPGALSTRILKKFINEGWDLSAHATGDVELTSLTREEQIEQLAVSKAYMWHYLWASDIFIFPFGKFDQELIDTTEKYYLAGRGYNDGINAIPIDRFNLQIYSLENTSTIKDIKTRLEKARLANGLVIFVGHHTGDPASSQFTISPDLLDSAIAYAKNLDVRVITLDQAVQELGKNTRSLEGNTAHWEFDKSHLKEGKNTFQVKIDERYSEKKSINI